MNMPRMTTFHKDPTKLKLLHYGQEESRFQHGLLVSPAPQVNYILRANLLFTQPLK
jgi:hypothetical protein